MSVEALISTQVIDTTTVGRALMTAIDASGARTALGLGSLATQSGTFSGTSSGTNTGDQTIALTGDVTGTGTGSFTATIGALKVTNAMLAGSIAASNLVGTDIATLGTVTAGTLSTGAVIGGVTVTLGSDATGDIYYRNASGVFNRLGIGSAAQVLTVSGGLPSWAASSGLSGTGAVDNAILRADGTGGATLQSSAFTIADLETASPNNTVNNVSMAPTGGTTNVSVSIVPKGTGAFCLAVPDGTSAGGNARGANAVDMQSVRGAASQVASGSSSVAIGSSNTASGISANAIGYNNNVSGNRASAFGYQNSASGSRASGMGHFSTASGNYSSAVGYSNTASGQYSAAVGRGNTASQSHTSAFGNLCVASASKSSAFGYRAKTSVANTVEVGYWSAATTRGAAIRVHGTTGMSSMSIQNTATAYTDGGATAGAEADSTLGREMISLRRNGDVLLLDVNIGGTVKTLSLGSAT